MRVRYRIIAVKNRLKKSNNETLGLLSDAELFGYYRLIYIGLLGGSILIPMTLLNTYMKGPLVVVFFKIIDQNYSNISKYYNSTEFLYIQILVCSLWVLFFGIYSLILYNKYKTPRMLSSFRPKLQIYQRRNMIWVVLITILVLVGQSFMMLYGLWFYLAYFFSAILLVGFIYFYLFDMSEKKARLQWSFLIGFILLLIGQIILHIISSTSIWEGDYNKVAISLQILRGSVFVGSLIGWGNEK
jgi:hypothetical protein